MPIEHDFELPPEVRQHGENYDDAYYYRAGHVIMEIDERGRDYVDGMMDRFGLVGLADNQDDLDPRTGEELSRLEQLGVVLCMAPDDRREDVPNLVDEIRRSEQDSAFVPRVYPNHIWAGANHMSFGNDRPPARADASEGFPPPDAIAMEDIRVAVIDTGITPHHAFPEWVHVSPDGDTSGHGTFIAGVIVRFAPYVEVFSTKALHVQGDVTAGDHTHCYVDDMSLTLRLLDIADGVDDIDIVNLSVAGPVYWNLDNALVGFGVREIRERRPQTAIVAAAGNWHSDRRNYPAALPGVTAVAAIDTNTKGPANYTSFGSWVDVRAVGDMVSTFPVVPAPLDSGWVHWEGTSFAAPVVVAAIAEEMRRSGDGASVAADRIVADAKAAGTSKPCLGVLIEAPVR